MAVSAGTAGAARAAGTRRASVAVLGAAALFGTTGTAQALGPAGTTPLSLGTLRIGLGAVVLWVLARRGPHRMDLVRHRWPLLFGALGVAAYQPSFFTGTQRSGVALGTIVALGSGPLFAGAIEAGWLGKAPSPAWWIATAVSVLGGAMLVLAGDARADFAAVGLAGSLGAGLSYAVYAMAAKVLIGRGMPATVALAWPFTLGALALVPFAIGEPWGWTLGLPGLVMVAHLAIVTVGLAYYLYGYGLRTLDVSAAVTLTLAEPLTAVLLGVSVLDERLRPFGWAGAALVVAGLVLAGGAVHRQAS